MSASGFQHVYGPVPSRRLLRSLGIDLVPFKTCTYDCVYCQLGRTTNKTLERKEYVAAEEVLAELEQKLTDKNKPDFISLAGSGEPTLNSAIGGLISRIKDLTDIPVAVLTNGSLLWMDEVQDALMTADLVLPSLDAGSEELFQRINRPHRDISFQCMVEGITAFTGRFPGEVWLEVFLLVGTTGRRSEVKKIASLAEQIAPARIQLNTLARPPAEESELPLSTDRMLELQNLFTGRVEIISGSEEDGLNMTPHFHTKDEDILALLGRRPCTSVDVAQRLGIHATESLKHLNRLSTSGKVKTVVTGGQRFYVAAGSVEKSLRSKRDAGV